MGSTGGASHAEDASSARRLLGNVVTVGVATLGSRVLGFVRDAMIAAVLGTSPVADAFVVAFRLPNLFRRLFAEGAFSAAFVPTLIGVREGEGDLAARRFAGVAMVTLLWVVAAACVPAMIFAEDLVGLIAPGFEDAAPTKLALAAELTRLCFPYLAAVSAVALFAGVLGAARRFLAAAMAPVVLNVVLIATLLGLLLAAGTPVFAGRMLAAAVAVAGLLQVGLLVAACARAGLLPRPTLPRRTPALDRFVRALGPGLVAGGLVEINVVVGTMIASLDQGGVSWLYYADRLYQLPLGVVGIAVGQVLLPEISQGVAADAGERVRAVLARALEFALALALPAAIALFVLAHPIVSILFVRGAFGPADAVATAAAVAAYAVGLPAFVAMKVLQPAFWGRGDTATPMRIGALVVAVNVVAALALHPFVGWIAVAVSTSFAGWTGVALAWGLLLRRGAATIDPTFRRRMPRLLLAALAMGTLVAALRFALLEPLFFAASTVLRVGALAGLVVVGLAVFAGFVTLLGVVDRADLRRLLAHRRAGDDEASCSPSPDRA